MHTYLYVIPAVIVIGIVLSRVARNKSGIDYKNFDFEKELGNYETHRDELLNGLFQKIPQWMKGEPIDCFTSAAVGETNKEIMKGHLKRAAKSAAWNLVGFKYIEREADMYAVLSGNNLHLLVANKHGSLGNHIVFGEEDLKKATLKHIGKKRDVTKVGFTKTENLPENYQLSVMFEGKELWIEFQDNIKAPHEAIKVGNMSNIMAGALKQKVVGQKFLALLIEKYPHLRNY